MFETANARQKELQVLNYPQEIGRVDYSSIKNNWYDICTWILTRVCFLHSNLQISFQDSRVSSQNSLLLFKQ